MAVKCFPVGELALPILKNRVAPEIEEAVPAMAIE